MFGPFLNTILSDIVGVLSVVLWVALPLFLVAVAWRLRLLSLRVRFLQKQKWDLLEVRVPETNLRTPRAMEQVFSSLYGIYSFGIPWLGKYKEGKIDLWISFEMVGKADGIRFFVRTPAQFRNLVEAALYSQYPDIEITATDDYVYDFGTIVPNASFDLWGAGFKQGKSRVYPIRTHHEFEEVKEEKTVDPLAGIFEAMSKLKGDETICIQLLISPAGSATGIDIKKEAEEEIKTIIEEKGFRRLNNEGEEIIATGTSSLSPGMQDVVKAVERKSGQLNFETTFRFLYIDKKDGFNGANIAAIMGSLQQFNTQNMNGLRPDGMITVFGGWMALLFPAYKKMVMASKKRKLFDYYSSRRFGMNNHLTDEKMPVFSVEELATLFHFPRSFIRAPKLRSAYSKRQVPPSNLPTE